MFKLKNFSLTKYQHCLHRANFKAITRFLIPHNFILPSSALVFYLQLTESSYFKFILHFFDFYFFSFCFVGGIILSSIFYTPALSVVANNKHPYIKSLFSSIVTVWDLKRQKVREWHKILIFSTNFPNLRSWHLINYINWEIFLASRFD